MQIYIIPRYLLVEVTRMNIFKVIKDWTIDQEK
jgi:hypothetical protein